MKQLHFAKIKICQESISVHICYVKEFHPDFPLKTIQVPTAFKNAHHTAILHGAAQFPAHNHFMTTVNAGKPLSSTVP